MPNLEKSALLAHSAHHMFDLVDAVEQYPAFLPWCGGARALSRSDERTIATIDIDYRGLRQSFTTENEKLPDRTISMRLVEGPFRRLEGRWDFLPLGDAGCKVALRLDYEVASGPLATLLTPVFGIIADTLIDRFIARADALYRAP